MAGNGGVVFHSLVNFTSSRTLSKLALWLSSSVCVLNVRALRGMYVRAFVCTCARAAPLHSDWPGEAARFVDLCAGCACMCAYALYDDHTRCCPLFEDAGRRENVANQPMMKVEVVWGSTPGNSLFPWTVLLLRPILPFTTLILERGLWKGRAYAAEPSNLLTLKKISKGRL